MNERIQTFHILRERGERIAVLTAYDYPTARLLDESGIDVILVGDSLGMVVLGYPDTTLVTMEEMLHHTRAVARGVQRALIIADLPFGSTDSPELALANSRRFLDAGAHAVKLEGGASHTAQVAALASAGIPVMAHIGMQPQRVRIEGGYRIKGRTPEQAGSLLTDAAVVEKAGAFGLLLELVVPSVAKEITARENPDHRHRLRSGLQRSGARAARRDRPLPVVQAEVRHAAQRRGCGNSQGRRRVRAFRERRKT